MKPTRRAEPRLRAIGQSGGRTLCSGGRRLAGHSPASQRTGRGEVSLTNMRALLHRGFGLGVDQVLCGTLALLHRRHAGRRVSTRDAAEKYFVACEGQTRAEHFALPPVMHGWREEAPDTISWSSPAASAAEFPVNGRARDPLSGAPGCPDGHHAAHPCRSPWPATGFGRGALTR